MTNYKQQILTKKPNSMKKLVFLSVIAAIAMTLISCDKTSDPVTVDSLPKVTVSGYVKANFGGLMDVAVPAGTILNFSIPNSNYGGASGNYIIQATTDADGKYSVQIPVYTVPITLSVFGTNFTHSYKESATVTYNKVYTLSPQALTVTPYVDQPNKNYTFVAQNITDINGDIIPTKTVTLSGKLEYKSAIVSSVYDTTAIPTGTVVDVYIKLQANGSLAQYEEERQITVGANGTYSIDVPMIEAGVATVRMRSEINLEYKNETNPKYWFRYTLDEIVNLYEYPITKNLMYVRGSQLSF
jgi:hypothetical protein